MKYGVWTGPKLKNQNSNSKNKRIQKKKKQTAVKKCQTQGVLERSSVPEAHDKVLDNNPDRIGIWKCWFLRRGGIHCAISAPLNNKHNELTHFYGYYWKCLWTEHMNGQVSIKKMFKSNMFITAVCFLFLIKLRWPKNKNIYNAGKDWVRVSVGGSVHGLLE